MILGRKRVECPVAEARWPQDGALYLSLGCRHLEGRIDRLF